MNAPRVVSKNQQSGSALRFLASSVEDQRKHWPIAVEQAHTKIPRLNAALAPHAPRIEALMQKAQNEHTPRKVRLRLLLLAAAIYGRVADGIVACKRGCSHCCHIPVAVAPLEAQVIGEAIGIKPARPALHSDFKRYPSGYDHPCRFLTAEGACSIYAHRPMMCRTLLSAADDAHQCELHGGGAADVPYVDTRSMQMLYGVLTFSDGGLAELGEFFPRADRYGHSGSPMRRREDAPRRGVAAGT